MCDIIDTIYTRLLFSYFVPCPDISTVYPIIVYLLAARCATTK